MKDEASIPQLSYTEPPALIKVVRFAYGGTDATEHVIFNIGGQVITGGVTS